MTEPIAVTGIAEVVIEVLDLERSEAFYAGVLGFPVTERWVERGVTWIDVCDSTHIGLWRPHLGTGGSRGGVHVHFSMHVPGEAEIQRVVQRLQAAGVDFHDQQYPDAHGIYITDPDGHVVEFSAATLYQSTNRGEP